MSHLLLQAVVVVPRTAMRRHAQRDVDSSDFSQTVAHYGVDDRTISIG